MHREMEKKVATLTSFSSDSLLTQSFVSTGLQLRNFD